MKNISKKTDEEIVELTRKKDKELFAVIINRYQKKLLRYCFNLVADHDIASDVVQESLIKAYINLNGFNTNKKFSSWIYRIVHNEAISYLRKNRKTINIDENIDFDSGVNLEDDLMLKELKSNAKKCIRKMPTIYGEPLILFYLEEKSYEEISDILRIPTSTVGTRINRAKNLMKKICQKII